MVFKTPPQRCCAAQARLLPLAPSPEQVAFCSGDPDELPPFGVWG